MASRKTANAAAAATTPADARKLHDFGPKRKAKLPLGEITPDKQFQFRPELTKDSVVKRWAELLRQNREIKPGKDEGPDTVLPKTEFPPIVVFKLNRRGHDVYVIADGFNRYYAHKEAECNEIDCIVYEGTEDDARRYALQANNDHGIMRDAKHLQNVIRCAWTEWNDQWGKKTERAVAALCQCSKTFVHKTVKRMAEQERGDGERKRHYKDALDKTVPEELHEVWAGVNQMRKAARSIDDVLKVINKKGFEWTRDTIPYTQDLDVEALEAALVHEKQRIEQATPACVCPAHEVGKGASCELCDGMDWLSVRMFEEARKTDRWGALLMAGGNPPAAPEGDAEPQDDTPPATNGKVKKGNGKKGNGKKGSAPPADQTEDVVPEGIDDEEYARQNAPGTSFGDSTGDLLEDTEPIMDDQA